MCLLNRKNLNAILFHKFWTHYVDIFFIGTLGINTAFVWHVPYKSRQCIMFTLSASWKNAYKSLVYKVWRHFLRAQSAYISKITVAPANWFTHICIVTQSPCHDYGECTYTHNVRQPAQQQHWGNTHVRACVTSWLLQRIEQGWHLSSVLWKNKKECIQHPSYEISKS